MIQPKGLKRRKRRALLPKKGLGLMLVTIFCPIIWSFMWFLICYVKKFKNGQKPDYESSKTQLHIVRSHATSHHEICVICARNLNPQFIKKICNFVHSSIFALRGNRTRIAESADQWLTHYTIWAVDKILSM